MSEQQLDLQSINLDFDAQGLEPITVPVKYKGVDYILLEANEDVAIRYKDMGFAAAKWSPGDDGKPRQASLTGLSKTRSFLISRCLFRAAMIDDGSGKEVPTLPVQKNGDPDRKQLVPEATILNWPHRFTAQLFDTCVLISKLRDQDKKQQAPESSESIEKQIEELQLKLDKARAMEQGGENPDPNPTEATDIASD